MSQAAAPIRAGIIGAGFIGGVHAQAVWSSHGIITRVSARTEEAAKDAARRFGATSYAQSAEALIASDDVDVVHICTPNATHAALASPSEARVGVTGRRL